MSLRQKIIAGNWKMNGSLAANAPLLAAVSAAQTPPGVQVVVCTPFPYLAQAQAALAGSAAAWGAQDVSTHAKGAYTGETSAAMLADLGCRYVIVGHSERRTYHGESDAQVAAKFMAAQAGGLTPIVCIGETLDERERGVTAEVVLRQLDAVIAAAGNAAFARAVIAYEPVWAIGTGRTASPEQAQEVHALIRSRIIGADAAVGATVPVLYGGSMKADNAAQLLAQPDIDGGLIGGASLIAADFLAIVAAAVAAS